MKYTEIQHRLRDIERQELKAKEEREKLAKQASKLTVRCGPFQCGVSQDGDLLLRFEGCGPDVGVGQSELEQFSEFITQLDSVFLGGRDVLKEELKDARNDTNILEGQIAKLKDELESTTELLNEIRAEYKKHRAQAAEEVTQGTAEIARLNRMVENLEAKLGDRVNEPEEEVPAPPPVGHAEGLGQ